MKTRLVVALLLTALIASSGCRGESTNHGEVCPRTVAAFDVRVSALSGSLPADTRIDVTFGGSVTESYEMGSYSAENQVLCCVVGDGDGVQLSPASCGVPIDASPVVAANADAGLPVEIRCSVWSNGAAKIIVSGGSFNPIERTLIAEEDERYPDCTALRTVGASLILGDSDAGANLGH